MSPPLPLVEGKLLRQVRTFHTWKWRQVYLDKENLNVFNTRGARRGELIRLGPLNSTGGADIYIRLFEAPKPNGFELRVRDDKMLFAAESESDRDRWVDALVEHWGATLDQASVNISTDRDRQQAQRHFPEVPPLSLDGLGPLIEPTSTIQFPARLKATGDVLMGVGSFIRRVRWTDEPILAVALYINASAVGDAFDAFKGYSLERLYDDPTFYTAFMDAPFRKTFVFSCRKRLSRNGIIAALHDEIRPRIGAAVNELVVLTTFIEKSLKKGESMLCTIESSKILDFHFKGFSHPSIAAPSLCRCLQALFFDNNSIQLDAKRGLIERVPELWGASPATTTLSKHVSEDDDDDEDEEDDEEEEDEKQQLLRRQSSTLSLNNFGPMIDPDSSDVFPGTIAPLPDQSLLLLGTRAYATGSVQCAVGLYVDPIAATEHLLRFKGLSFGSVETDPDFFVAFTTGAFAKCVRLAVRQAMPIASLASLLAHLLTESHCLQETQSIMDLFHALPTTTLHTHAALWMIVRADGTFHVQIDSASPSTTSPLSPAQQSALGTAIQSLFYGYHASDVHARAQLMQRLPALLDRAKADLVHTYQDEIVMLKENYKRLTPANRIKVGYLTLYNKKRTMMLKWSRRWCRLDGVVLSLFSHKMNSRPKEVIVLSNCTIRDLSSHEEMLGELRKLDHIALVLGITQASGDVLVLRAETVAEGTEWIEALTEASRLPVKQLSTTSVPLQETTASGMPTLQEESRDDDEDEILDVGCDMVTHSETIGVEDGDKDRQVVGSLVQWILEDTRNQIILILLSFLVWTLSELLPGGSGASDL
ncbi:hypothetical protein AC1031_016386 [Aphanomyces cochlioides]|nr:hypothetical protein AC1031_016386 [Aphanomyces cochlioides]